MWEKKQEMGWVMRVSCAALLFVAAVSAQGVAADRLLYGLVGTGEECVAAGTGCTDAGKLVMIDLETSGAVVTAVAATGLDDPTALTFDPINRELVAGTASGKIYVLDRDTGTANKIVNVLLTDPAPPAEIQGKFGGPRSLTALDFHPATGELFGVVKNSAGGDYLVRLDLNAVDTSKRLEVDVIGVIGSSNYAYPDAPFGFANVQGIAFRDNGQLFGTGVKLQSGSGVPYLIQISTTPVPSGGLAFETDAEELENVNSFPRAMAFCADQPYMPSFVISVISDYASPANFQQYLFDVSFSNGDGPYPYSLDGQIRGLAYFPELPVEPPRMPEIQSFYPAGGNAGIIVTIRGSGFSANGAANVSDVYFDGVPVLGTPVVISDEELRVIVPNAASGPITVLVFTDSDGDGSNDEATSTQPFGRAELAVDIVEANQGIPSYPAVAGKDTLVRLLTSSSVHGAYWPVTFGTATMTITQPSGQTVPVVPTCYRRIFYNSEIVPSHLHNINFYVSGDLLDDPGSYQFDFEVRSFSLSGPGDVIYSSTWGREFLEPKGDFRVLYTYGFPRGHPEEAWPNEEAQLSIAKVFQEASRVFPVRNGIGLLGDESAGVQVEFLGALEFRTEYTAGVGDLEPCEQLDNGWGRTLENALEEYNEANCDRTKAEYIVGFMRSDSLRMPYDPLGRSTAMGCRPKGKKYSASGIYAGDTRNGIKPMDRQRSVVAIHEFGHCMGRVGEHSPNYSGDDNHSVNDSFPPNASWRDVRAFNILTHEALETLPRSVMHVPSPFVADIQADGEFFFEEYEFIQILNRGKYWGKVPDACGWIGCSWPFCSELYIRASIQEDDSGNASAEIIKSYIVQDRPLTDLDPSSPYSLVLLDASSQILAQDPFEVTIGSESYTDSRSDVVTLNRPLPTDAVQAQIRKDDQVLVSLIRSYQVPEITRIDSPSYGDDFGPDEDVFIEWTASDPDGDPLRFSLYYTPNSNASPGEVRWFPIASGISDTITLWNTACSPGTDSGQIRLIATDGFNATVAYSEVFSVASKPPMVSIVQPTEGKVFQEFDSIVLEGFAYDLEHGVLDGQFMNWSTTSGPLGTGRRLVLGPDAHAPGVWPIYLTVDDGDWIITRMVQITVLADSDRDGLTDDFENQYGSQDPADPYDAAKDVDADGLTSLQEATAGTDPENSDTDGDGLSDLEEVEIGTNPLIDTYTLTTSSTFGGSVTTPGEETKEYDYGKIVELVATATEADCHFVRWTGPVADASSENTTVTITTDTSVKAVFARTSTYDSTVDSSDAQPGAYFFPPGIDDDDIWDTEGGKYYRGYFRDWGWTHTFSPPESMPDVINWAKLKIAAYDVDSDEVNLIYGDGVLLGQLEPRDDRWCVTTFQLSPDALNELMDGTMDMRMDIGTGAGATRTVLKLALRSSTLTVNYDTIFENN